MPDLVRLGLAGVGPWGRNIVRTIDALPDVKLAAVASRNRETSTLVEAECQIVADWRELMAIEDLDGIVVATPPATHAEIMHSAIEARLPVFVEKPLTLDVQEARDLLEHAQARKVFALVDHIHLFNPAFHAVRDQIPDMGRITVIDGLAGNAGPYRNDVSVLWDWGAHDVAMCLDVLDEIPVSVRAYQVMRESVDSHVAEIVEIELSFSSGCDASLRVGNGMREKVRSFVMHCDSGTLEYDDCADLKAVIVDKAGQRQPIDYGGESPLACAIDAFVTAVRQRHSQLTSLELAVHVTEVLARAETSLKMSGQAA